MLLRVLVVALLLSVISLVDAQVVLESDPLAAAFFAEKIDADQLKKHITKLSAPDLEGRETGQPGLAKAAEYLIDQFESWGIESPKGIKYRQNVTFSWVKWENASIAVGEESFDFMKDFICLPTKSQNLPNLEAKDVVFVGYGIDDPAYSDYKKVNVQGKVAMIYPGEPFDKDSISYVSSTRQGSEWSTNFELKRKAAADAGVRTLLVIDPKITQTIADNRNAVNQRLTFTPPTEIKGPNVIYISTDIAEAIIGDRRNSFIKNRRRITNTGVGRPLHLKSSQVVIRQHLSRNAILSENILAYIEGIDEELKDEVVVISGHYDHLGKRGGSYFPGADDNASGTAAVLEIMHSLRLAYLEGEGPRRSVMAILFTGEEKGLLGSQYYAEHPVIPLEQTVVDVNIDMIGRVDDRHASDHYIYVIGSDRLSTTLHHINEATNNTFSHLELDYKFNERDDPNRFYYRSDHYNFAKHGIPSIFFFSGVHEDYHQPGDTVDKIMFPKYTAVVRQIFHTVWEVANREQRLLVDVKDDTNYNR